MSATTQLQQLTQAIADKRLSHAATLGFALAGQGGLPIVDLFNLAQELAVAGDRQQAIALYRVWLAHTDTPLAYAGHFNLAVALAQADDADGAEQAYRKAISLNPEFIEAYLNLGTLYESRQEPEAALKIWRRALQLIHPALPNSQALHVKLLNQLGRLLEQRKRYTEANQMLTRSLLLEPQQPPVLAHWIQLRQRQCLWPVYQELAELTAADMELATAPAATLALSDDPDAQLAAARHHLQQLVPDAAQLAPLAARDGYGHKRLRVAYLAADFCAHPAALALELCELHERAKFEVYGFCWQAPDDSQRARLAAAFDHLIELGPLSGKQAAQAIRSHEIDVLVDLHGLQPDARPAIAALRPAPVQIAWLGYPASTALDAIDHVLADRYVLPPAMAPFFSEKPLYLPDAFLAAPRQRLSGTPASRAGCGLPQDAFVYCCFSASHKITAEIWASWMCILQRAPSGVLWLLAENEQMRINLLGAAAAYGVPASRLFFAERVGQAEHLARLAVADLLLDTWPHSSGAGATDALWAGLPLLTRAGHSYASRMAGSLLHTAGLPQLVTSSRAEYEALAVALAADPVRMSGLRRHLLDTHDSSPLFDLPRFVRQLEQTYRQVARGMQRGGKRQAPPPAAVTLPLVSILLPAHGTRMLEPALLSALSQHYANCEIIISDSGPAAGPVPKVAKYLKRYPRIRYVHAPGLTQQANLANCLALAGGEYVSFALEGEILHADKIEQMMKVYRSYPGVGLVTSFRQCEDGSDSALFALDTVINGGSLGQSMLADSRALAGPLGAMLLRRADLGAAIGQYQGRQYRLLDDVATALSMLAGRDCVYLSAPLTSYSATAAAAPAPAQGDALGIEAAVEWLHLLYDAWQQRQFVTDAAAFRRLLAGRLAAFTNQLATQHEQLRAEGCNLEEIHLALRQGYQLLLAD